MLGDGYRRIGQTIVEPPADSPDRQAGRPIGQNGSNRWLPVDQRRRPVQQRQAIRLFFVLIGSKLL